MLDDAAFYAANSLVSDRFLLTTAFNLLFTKPLTKGPVVAEGRWISGKRRVYVADARLIDAEGEEVRSEEHTSELQSLMRISYAVFCLKKKTANTLNTVNDITE